MASLAAACLPASWGADAILKPWRRPLTPTTLGHRDVSFDSDGLKLRGWLFVAEGERRGTLLYLHGHADNRRGAEGLARRFVSKGWDVLAYDARAHGESEGAWCTYGFHEKKDVSRALDAVAATNAVLFGSSLGAAVALQAAAEDSRVRGVIAQSPFATLDSIIDERAPLFATHAEVEKAKRIAEERAGFRIADVSPEHAALAIAVPVLLLHGDSDRETAPLHSRRIATALGERCRLIMVKGAGHNDVLAREEVWEEIAAFLASVN